LNLWFVWLSNDNNFSNIDFRFTRTEIITFGKKIIQVEAREHTKNDPDKYQFVAIKNLFEYAVQFLGFGYLEKDIQIPVKLCMEQPKFQSTRQTFRI
jgi:hypothetical protein